MKLMKVLFLLNGILNFFLYVWRFKECSINVRLLLFCWGSWCRGVYEDVVWERVYLYVFYMEFFIISISYIWFSENNILVMLNRI